MLTVLLLATSMDDQNLSPIISQKLAELRQALRRFVTLHSLSWAALWCLAVFWIGGLIDYLPVRIGASETPRWVRVCMLSILIIGLLWIVVVYFLPKFYRRLLPANLAVALERHFPSLGSSLVTAVELLDRKKLDGKLAEVSNPSAYKAMLHEAHVEAQRRVKPLDVSEAINWQPVWMSTSLLVVSALLSIGIASTMTDWTTMWASRLFGLSEARWPRSAELRAEGVEFSIPLFTGETSASRLQIAFNENSTVRVPAGTDVLLQVGANVDAPRTPDVCTMYYRFDSGSRGRANLRKIGSPVEAWQPFNLDGPPLDALSENVWLDVVGLDGRLRDLRIEVVEPAVALETQVECRYPSYLTNGNTGNLRAGSEKLEYRNAMRVPEGTDIALVGRASSPLQEVEYLIVSNTAAVEERNISDADMPGNQPVDSGQPTKESSEPAADTADATAVQRVDANGEQFVIRLGQIRENMVVETRLIDQFGLPSSTIARYVINVLPDTLPEVDTRFVGIGSAVTEQAILPIEGTVVDDHAVATVSVEVAVGDGAITAVPQVNSGEAFAAQLDLQKLKEQSVIDVSVGQSIGISVTASDYYELDPQGDGGKEPTNDKRLSSRVGRSTPKRLSVVTIDELLILLDRQELEQRQRLDIIISELGELNDLLEKFGTALTADALAEPSAAEAESSLTQARRLDIMGQQAVMQSDKSQQELVGVSNRIENVRQQLVNNRTGNYDRIDRLGKKVVEPLEGLLNLQFAELQAQLGQLRKLVRGGVETNLVQLEQQSESAGSLLDEILSELASIQTNMLDMESFNEIVDLVRGLLDEQDDLMNRTKEEQQKRILDLFNN